MNKFIAVSIALGASGVALAALPVALANCDSCHRTVDAPPVFRSQAADQTVAVAPISAKMAQAIQDFKRAQI